jgi:serine/threonine protein kinase
MSLAPGDRIGLFEIVGLVGEGGMGRVYRARDQKLARTVAIKVLPDAFARDAERLARFRREAQALAALNDPHIAQIYQLEESDQRAALVMEFVEGRTIADAILVKAIDLDDALRLGGEIAAGLETAHEKGIVHRDLKPANVKITADGHAKILDFGLAKAMAGDSTSAEVMNSPTLTARATEAGIILGTAAYMSPEQARGKAVDKRTDIWAFGALLYEMLTGRRAFEGETVSDTLASVLRSEPHLINAVPRARRDSPAARHRRSEAGARRRHNGGDQRPATHICNGINNFHTRAGSSAALALDRRDGRTRARGGCALVDLVADPAAHSDRPGRESRNRDRGAGGHGVRDRVEFRGRRAVARRHESRVRGLHCQVRVDLGAIARA